MDLTKRIAEQGEEEARRAELDRRDREHGGLIPRDRETEAKRRSVAGWGPHKLETTAADISGATAEAARRFRHESIRAMWIDCGAAVRRFAPAYRREDAVTVQGDALLWLVRWPRHGGGTRKDGSRAPKLDLGGIDGTPLRSDWRETVEREDGRAELRLTSAAWRALHAAVKQAVDSPANRGQRVCQVCEYRPAEGWTEATDATPRLDRCAQCATATAGTWHPYRDVQPLEVPTGDYLDVAALSEDFQRESGAATRLPDCAAPEVVAEMLGLPLDGGRAIVARAFPAASPRDLAEGWRISEQAAKNALSRGAAHVRRAYPNPIDLVRDLETVAPRYRALTASGAALALLALRGGEIGETAARAALDDYRATHSDLPPAVAAVLAAARAALRREGMDAATAAERGELIAGCVTRLTRAEARRAEHTAAIASHGGGLPGRTLPMAAQRHSGAHVTSETAASRVWTYGLTAREDRAGRTGEAVTVPPRPRPRPRATATAAPTAAPATRRRIDNGRPGCRACLLGLPHSDHPHAKADRGMEEVGRA